MLNKILILDFGSQYTQLIARRVREANVYSEVVPFNKSIDINDESIKGIILSGSPFSVTESNSLTFDFQNILGKIPILGICYGAQYIANALGGLVQKSDKREYGKAILKIETDDLIFSDWSDNSQVWMSHSDTIKHVPENFDILATTSSIPVAAYRSKSGAYQNPIYCVQFHPEVSHTVDGKKLIENFVFKICNCKNDWTPDAFVQSTIADLKNILGNEHVLMGLSGGVDSSVAATLLHHAIGDRLHCFFIDNGLLRKNEFEEVMQSYESLDLHCEGVDAKAEFYAALKGLTLPEDKRKAIGRTFIEIFDREAKAHPEVKWLGQGTIYPDVIESVSVHGPSVTIKSHHNVGGLPDKLHLKLVEPLRMLFKDEVRIIGHHLKIPANLLNRHPFPGPGLGIRILGEITPEKVALLQEADHIFIETMKDHQLYAEVWQAGAILLPIQSVGVMGDERTYEKTIALRAVTSLDGMTAEWSRLPYEFLAEVSSKIINNVKGINRVVYDISTKPPSTIEWE
ncbi:MAG: glutamine-hydrolyzing GMP synthase [Saprospiraceae bacterium]|nr:glutamine-hydrolyzing GMP synthase [Saprospiraceae bacterium]